MTMRLRRLAAGSTGCRRFAPGLPGEYRKTVRAFYAEHPEYRVIHSHMSELGYYDFREAEKAGVPVRICHAHNRPYGIDLKSPVRWYYKTMMRPHITDLFICGKESGDWLFGRKNEARFIQLNNAIDARQYAYCPEIRQKMRQSLGIGEDQLVIGTWGAFIRRRTISLSLIFFRLSGRKIPRRFCCWWEMTPVRAERKSTRRQSSWG